MIIQIASYNLCESLRSCFVAITDTETNKGNVFFIGCRDHSNFANCVRFSPDGSKFISVSSDKKGILYDGKTGEKIGELSSEDGHKGSIYAVSWSPDGKQVHGILSFK